MQLYIIINFLLLMLCLLDYTTYAFNPKQKDWLDRCDLERLKKENEITATITPTTKKPISGSAGGIRSMGGGSASKLWALMALAPTEELLEIIKQKHQLDVRTRGMDEADWSNDARGIISEFYDEYHTDDEASDTHERRIYIKEENPVLDYYDY